MLKENTTLHVSVLMLAVVSTIPFTLSRIDWYANSYILAFVFVLVLTFLSIKKRISLGLKSIYFVLYCQAIFLVVAYAYHGHYPYLGNFLIVIYTTLLYFYIINYISIKDVANTIVWFFTILGVLAAVVFWLGIIYNLSPFLEHENLDGRVAYNYVLSFTNAEFRFGNFKIIRVASYFDEPGTFAFYLTIALLINKVHLNRKINEWTIIVSGLFTLSVAFYIVITIYLVIYYYKNFKFIILFSLILLSLVAVLTEYKDKNIVVGEVYSRSLDRLKLDTTSDRVIKGDNRTGVMELAYGAFMEHPLMGVGSGHRNDKQNPYYGSHLGGTPFSPLAQHGIFGTLFEFLHVALLLLILFYLSLFGSSNKKINLNALKPILIIVPLLLQRPYVVNILFYIMIIVLIHLTSRKYS